MRSAQEAISINTVLVPRRFVGRYSSKAVQRTPRTLGRPSVVRCSALRSIGAPRAHFCRPSNW